MNKDVYVYNVSTPKTELASSVVCIFAVERRLRMDVKRTRAANVRVYAVCTMCNVQTSDTDTILLL